MSSSIHDIVRLINSSLSGLVKGGKWQGVASTARRGKQSMPVIDEKHAGIDDKLPMVAYHKLGTITSRQVEGMGRLQDQLNIYQNSMVVFVNRKQCQLYPDELLLHIQANIPEEVKMQPYSSLLINITNTQLDSEAVYNQEYEDSDYRLKTEQYLFRINYTVETIFKKGCFKTCPQN